MEDELRTDIREKSVSTSRCEVELQSQPDSVALRPDDPDDIEVPKPFHPEEARTSSVRAKAMAASTPGSEYWLP